MSAILDPSQLALPIAEPHHYHANTFDASFIGLLVRQDSGRLRQQMFRATHLTTVLENAPRDRDAYLSQASFRQSNRRAVNVAGLPMLFADLDPTNKRTIPADEWRHKVLMFCGDEGIPRPR